MPTYTYRCQNCGVEFDKVQKFADKPLTRCPECRTGSVRRIPQPPAIVFKGSGWYATDHRSPSGQTNLHKSDGDSAKSESTASESTKTESKKAETTTTEKGDGKKADTSATKTETKPSKKA